VLTLPDGVELATPGHQTAEQRQSEEQAQHRDADIIDDAAGFTTNARPDIGERFGSAEVIARFTQPRGP
jgi:hypothetical protein